MVMYNLLLSQDNMTLYNITKALFNLDARAFVRVRLYSANCSLTLYEIISCFQ